MSDRKQTNKYIPPDFDPRKHGSVNKMVGSHPLRERAKKIKQGILVIRFEMPYNIWCGGCNSHIGMGVRYNAEKSKVGNYYTTPIYKFRMKCHLCDNYFEIQTDPQNHDYVILNGARRKEQRWDPAENGQIVTEDKNDVKKRATDSMYKLEHTVGDNVKKKNAMPNLSELEEIRQNYKDDYMLNKLARGIFREEKQKIKESNIADHNLLVKSSLNLKLLPETDGDMQMAHLLTYKSVDSYDEKQKKKRTEIESRSIFSTDVSTDVRPKNSKKRLLEIASKSSPGFSSSVRTLDSANLGIKTKNKTNVEPVSTDRKTEVVKPRTSALFSITDYQSSDSNDSDISNSAINNG